MTDHAEVALDQLRLADSCTNQHRPSWTEERTGYQVAALVHALLDVAQAVREAGLGAPVEWGMAEPRSPA